MVQRTRTLIALLVAALVSIAISASIRTRSPSCDYCGYGADGQSYWDLSGNLLAGRGFVDSPGMGHVFSYFTNTEFVPDIKRLPGYPLVLALGRLVWNSTEVVFIINYVLYGLILIYTFFLLMGWSKQDGIKFNSFNILTLAFSPIYLVHMQGTQADLCAGAFLMGFVFHALRAQDANSSLAHFVAAVGFGVLGVLTRPNNVAFSLPFLLVLVAAGFLRDRELPKLKLIVILLSVTLPLAAWSARNFRHTGLWGVSFLSGAGMFHQFALDPSELAPHSELYGWRERLRTKFMEEKISQGFTATQADARLDRKVGEVALNYALSRPKFFVHMMIHAFYSQFTSSLYDVAQIIPQKYWGGNQMAQAGIWALHMLYKVALLISFLCFPFVIYKKRDFVGAALWAGCLGLLLSSVLFSNGDRLRVPIHAINHLMLFVICAEMVLARWTLSPRFLKLRESRAD